MHLNIFLYFVCHFFLPFYCLLLVYYFFLDVLQFGIMREANSLADPSLRKIVPDLIDLQLDFQGSCHRTEIQIWLAEVA